MKNIIRWHRGTDYPFTSFNRDLSRLFAPFFSNKEWIPLAENWEEPTSQFHPSVDVTETDKEVRVQAELPGLDEKDVEVLLSNETLTLKGEKKGEVEEKGKNYYRMERSYGSFHRSISLPAEVQSEKVEATFEKGILTVTLPKSEKARDEYRKVPVKKA